MAAINSDVFKTINMTDVSVPNNLSEFPASVQQALVKALDVEKKIVTSVPIPVDPNTCPNITAGGTRKKVRGNASWQDVATPPPSDESGGEDTEVNTIHSDDALKVIRKNYQEIRKERQQALQAIANIPGEETKAKVDQQIEAIMAGNAFFATSEEAEQFALHAREIREGMIKARGLQPSTELKGLRDGEGGIGSAAAARAEEIRTLKANSKDERGDEGEERLQTLEAEETRMGQLIQEQYDNRYYYSLAVMSHAVAALSIGMSGAPSSFFNSIGDNIRFMFGADSLEQSCDMDNIWNLGYNGDCEEATRRAEVMWSTIIGVIGALAVSFFGIRLADTSNPFMILVSLSTYSIDSLAQLFRSMGGIQATLGTVGAITIAQTVGEVIKWPLSRLAGICRRAIGMQPSTSTGGRTKKHKRNTRGRKGKKMRKTKNKRKQGSRKKQNGGKVHTNMTDLYSTGGKRRRKGKGRKTHGKSKRRYGKKQGTRKH